MGYLYLDDKKMFDYRYIKPFKLFIKKSNL